MAVQNIPITEIYEFSKIIENGQIVVVDNPLLLYDSSGSDDCALVLNSCKDSNFSQNMPDLVLDTKYFQYDNKDELSNAVFDLSKSFELVPQNQEDQAFGVMGVYGNHGPDQPEFIDINQLSNLTDKPSCSNECDILEISDDDEVIFVKKYKSDEVCENALVICENVDSNIRRNPVRNVRNKSRDLSKDLLFEEDFAFLDADDDVIGEKENKASEKKPAPVKLPKEWPINVYERPEYNPVTNQIESFDYTIREIQKNAETFKKPKTESFPKRKNTKRKPAGKRKRISPPIVHVEKVPVDDLKPLINSTTDMLKNYFINSKKHKDLISLKSEICTFENKLEVLKNQAFLFAIVNNLDENEVIEKFKVLNVDGEGKS